ncbi:MAG: right-handed parallel beta-helix repeat-containing protein [Elusimicrobiota bacterium]
MNVDAGGNITQAGLRISSWTTVSNSSVTVGDSHGFWLNGSTMSSVSYSTAVNNSADNHAFYLDSAKNNAFSVIFASNSHNSGRGFYLKGSDTNTITQSYVWGGSSGTVLVQGSDYNAISLSSSIGRAWTGLYHNGSSSNTATRSYMWGGFRGAQWDAASNSNVISLSTMIGVSSQGLFVFMGDSNTVTQSRMESVNGWGVYLSISADYNTISLSTMISAGSTNTGLYSNQASSNTILNSYVQGSTAAYINGSTGTVITGTVFVATNTTGSALVLAVGSGNLLLTGNSLRAGPQGAAVWMEPGNSGFVTLNNNTIGGGLWGVRIATMTCGACDGNVSITSLTFSGGLTAGATAIHFDGGTFASTFTTVGFDDSNIAVDVNGSALDTASRITMTGYTGPKGGPAFENDPNSLVYWAAQLPAGCAAGVNVSQLGGWEFLAIQPAIDYLRTSAPSLGGDTCVVIRDTQTYSERVEVRGFTNNDFQFKIMSDPSFVSSAPVVNPPAFSTAGFYVQNTSVTILNVSVISTNSVSYGVYASSAYVTISSVNVDAGGNITQAGLRISSWTAVSYSSVTVFAAHGIVVDGTFNNVTYTNSVTSGTAVNALFVNGASSNTFSVLLASNPAGVAAKITGGGYNTISQSVVASNDGVAALTITSNASWNQVIGSVISNSSGAALGISANAKNNTISLSTMSINSPNYYALNVNNASSNTIVGSYLVNLGGHGAGIVSGAVYNTISQSTMVSAATGYAGFLISGASSNTVQGCLMTGQAGSGMFIQWSANYNIVRLSTITSLGSSSGYDGLYIRQSSSNTVVDSYIQGPTAVYLDGSSSTVIGGSVMIATNTVRHALWLTVGSMKLNVTSSTLRGGVNGAGLFMDPDNLGSITLTSNTITGGRWGVVVATMTCGACDGNVSITSLTFAGGLTAGATAIHFAGGTFTSTFATVGFNDANIAVDVNGSALNTASRITMTGYTGPKSGPAYENDFFGLVYWVSQLPAGCAAGVNVSQLGGWEFTAIQPAIDYLRTSAPSLGGDTCVVIRDTQTYSERVEVRGFTNNDFQFKILSDPSFVSSAPVVNPPAFSTAGFYVQNTSVTILNVSVISTNSVSYGVYASSDYVTISSVNVDAGGKITQAGMRISSWTAVSYSSVTVGNAYGFWLSGSTMSRVSFSTAINNSAGMYAAYLHFGGNNSFHVLFASNSHLNGSGLYALDSDTNSVTASYLWGGRYGAVLYAGSSHNSIVQSTMIGGTTDGLNLGGASSNTVTQSFMQGGLRGLVFTNGTRYNTISMSTMIGGGWQGFTATLADFNSITQSYMEGDLYGALIYTGADSNLISQSTMVARLNHGLYIEAASSNTVTGSFIVGAQYGAWLSSGATRNTISWSTVTSNAQAYAALFIHGSSSNTIMSSYVQGSTAVYISRSTDTIIGDSVLIATNTIGNALYLSSGSLNLTLSSSSLRGGVSGSAVRLEDFNSGNLTLSSNTIVGGSYGLFIATQTPGLFSLSVTSLTFAGGLTAGANAIHFEGGTFTSTFASVGFNDANIAVDVNGSALDTASRITMVGYTGPKSGPAYENDFFGLVYWVSQLPAGCAAGVNVSQLGGWEFLAIQPAIDYLRTSAPSLGGDTCVVIRDTQTYTERVEVRGFTNNDFQFKIMSDPSFVSSAPVVNPPAASTAAFLIQNASVTIAHINVLSTTPVSWGIWASSMNVVISSVNVDSGGNIWTAGIYLSSSQGRVEYTSVTVQSADGIYIRYGVRNSVIQSTMVSNNANYRALIIFDSDSNTVTGSYMRNLSGGAVVFSGNADFNTISLSTMVSNSISRVLTIGGASANNTVSGSYMQNLAGPGVALSGGAIYNTISQSTIVSDAAGYQGLYITGSASNTISSSYIRGSTAAFISGSSNTYIYGSIFVATNTGGSALEMGYQGSDLIVATSAFYGGTLGSAILLNANNAGTLRIDSNTIGSGQYGVWIATQAAGATLTISSLTFAGGLTPGATAIHFAGGTFISTFSKVAFNDANIAINVNASLLDTASTITMRSDAGLKTGPTYENDPFSIVDWGDLLPPDLPFIYAVGLSSITVQYGTVGADGYVVQASTMANFSGVLHTSATLSQAVRLAPQTLDPNTTYYLRAGSLWGTTTIYAETVLSSATLSKLVAGTDVYQINVTSMIINWLPFALAPPEASSNSAAGYDLQVSTLPDFSLLWTSSSTPNVALSTLTVGTLRGEVTYYFRVGSINSAGAVNYATAVSTMMPLVLGVEMSTRTISVPGMTDLDTTILITTSTVLTNTGNVKETYYIRVTTVTPGSPWHPGTTPGVDRFVVWSVINPAEPLPGDFEAVDDRLADSETPCGATVIAMGGGTCVQVPVGETRTLWSKIAMPVVTSTGDAQEIRIFARAVRDPDPDPNP